jgi:putative flippase GtrA
VTRRARFVVFNAVGALGAAVQLVCVGLLTEVGRVNYVTATAIAVAASGTHNFLWHRWWTWGDRLMPARAALLRFALSNGAVSMLGNMGVMITLVSGAHVSPVLANVVAIALCGLLNFCLGETFVFRKE